MSICSSVSRIARRRSLRREYRPTRIAPPTRPGVEPRHVGHQRVSGCAGRCRWRGCRRSSAVILAKLLGQIVMAVDQRRRVEDAVDPRLDLGSIGCAEPRSATLPSRRAIISMFARHARGFRQRCAAQSRGLATPRHAAVDAGAMEPPARSRRNACASTPMRESPTSTSISTG